jgi:hypothetical protein
MLKKQKTLHIKLSVVKNTKTVHFNPKNESTTSKLKTDLTKFTVWLSYQECYGLDS